MSAVDFPRPPLFCLDYGSLQFILLLIVATLSIFVAFLCGCWMHGCCCAAKKTGPSKLKPGMLTTMDAMVLYQIPGHEDRIPT